MENLNELQLSQSPQTASPKKEEPAESESKLSYEAQKELNKKIRKLEKQVADCEAKIEKLEEQVAQLDTAAVGTGRNEINKRDLIKITHL